MIVLSGELCAGWEYWRKLALHVKLGVQGRYPSPWTEQPAGPLLVTVHLFCHMNGFVYQ